MTTNEARTPNTSWAVYKALPKSWADFAEELNRWKQGDLILDVPVTWLLPGREDLITQATSECDEISPATHEELLTSAGIICSQTCDLGASGPGNKHPFFLFAPLVPYEFLPDGTAKSALQGGVGYLVPTKPPMSSSTGRGWFADLRILVPASKGLLLGRTPIRGFADEGSRMRFAESVAFKFRRPALSASLSEKLPDCIDGYILGNGPRKQAFVKVEQVRLLVDDQDHLNPQHVQLHVFSDIDLSEPEQELWRGWERNGAELLSRKKITLKPTLFTSAAIMKAAQYRKTIPMRLENLRTQAWW